MSRTDAHVPWHVSHPEYAVVKAVIGEEVPPVVVYGRHGVDRHFSSSCGCATCTSMRAEHRARLRSERHQTKKILRHWNGEDL